MGTASADDLASIHVELQDAVAIVHLTRPAKRNALNDERVSARTLVRADRRSRSKPSVLVGRRRSFLCGTRSLGAQGAQRRRRRAHSRSWHRAFEPIEFGTRPGRRGAHGAIVGGGLELAGPRISASRKPPPRRASEGSRGIYVGGARRARAETRGVARMMDMMLTGRTYGADEGYATSACRNTLCRTGRA